MVFNHANNHMTIIVSHMTLFLAGIVSHKVTWSFISHKKKIFIQSCDYQMSCGVSLIPDRRSSCHSSAAARKVCCMLTTESGTEPAYLNPCILRLIADGKWNTLTSFPDYPCHHLGMWSIDLEARKSHDSYRVTWPQPPQQYTFAPWSHICQTVYWWWASCLHVVWPCGQSAWHKGGFHQIET